MYFYKCTRDKVGRSTYFWWTDKHIYQGRTMLDICKAISCTLKRLRLNSRNVFLCILRSTAWLGVWGEQEVWVCLGRGDGSSLRSDMSVMSYLVGADFPRRPKGLSAPVRTCRKNSSVDYRGDNSILADLTATRTPGVSLPLSHQVKEEWWGVIFRLSVWIQTPRWCEIAPTSFSRSSNLVKSRTRVLTCTLIQRNSFWYCLGLRR